MTEHWNGSAWSIVASPNIGSVDNELFGVVSIAPNDAWAVGEEASGSDYHTLTEHWNGSTWSVVPSPDPDSSAGYNPELTGVAALANNDVWAVGYYEGSQNSNKDYITLIEHWNGAQWAIVDSPNPGSASNLLQAVGGNASSGLCAVGSGGDTNASSTFAITLQLMGGSWSQIASANPSPTDDELWGVSVLSSSNA